MYTVLVYENQWKICYNGRTPILKDIYYVIEQYEILRKTFPEKSYRIAKVEIQ